MGNTLRSTRGLLALVLALLAVPAFAHPYTEGVDTNAGDDLTLTADATPATVPIGGNVQITVRATNNTDLDITTDIWLVVDYNGGNPADSTIFVQTTTIPAGKTVVRRYNHEVPADFRPGQYVVTVNAGDFDTSTVIASDPYTVTVTAAGPQAAGDDLTLTADATPDTVPIGGNVRITIRATNNTDLDITTDIWLVVDYNGGNPADSTIFENTFTIPAGKTVLRNYFHVVPDDFRTGDYTVTVNAGDFDTSTVIASDSYTVTVTAARLAGGQTDGPGVVAEVPGGLLASATSSAAVSPNPFSGRTQIAYTVAATANVRLSVYDVLGREVAVLVDGALEAGAHAATFDARSLAPGTYVYRLVVGNEVQTGRMTLAH